MAHGDHGWRGANHDAWGPQRILESTNLVKSYSMDIINDPRFFQDNVINYRLAAFGTLSTVSGFLVGTVQADIFAMDKRMPIFRQTADGDWTVDADGSIQLFNFTVLCVIFFLNMLAVYVGVAQPYHAMRLMTSGPTGFETAASYYLNSNMVAWRHLAIKGMLVSLPMFVAQCGLRLVVKFDRGTYMMADPPDSVPYHSRVQGVFFSVLFGVMSIALLYCHHLHHAVFREQYKLIVSNMTPHSFTKHLQTMMTPRAHSDRPHDYEHLDV